MRSDHMTGRRFGRLVVIELSYSRYWKVRCDCGTEKNVRGNHLTCGLTKSCGCLAKEVSAEKGKKYQPITAAKRRAAAEMILADGMKRCTRSGCSQENPQPIINFDQNNTGAISGRASWCKVCRRDAHLRSSLGITLADKLSMISAQDGKCANGGCGVTLVMEGKKRNAHADHDHVTGQVRAVLCRDCNLALGYMQDSPEMIMGLLEYANKHRQLKLIQGGKK